MCRIVTIANQKGGVAKSTTAQAMTTGLTMRGYRALLIDADSQRNTSISFGIPKAEANLYAVMSGEIAIKEAIRHTAQGDIVPGDRMLAFAQERFVKPGREYIFRKAFASILDEYDYIVIDTPPSFGAITVNALAACRDVIVPMHADLYSLTGLMELNEVVSDVKEYYNPSVRIAGLLFTRYSDRSKLSRELKESFEKMAQKLGTKVFHAIIREGVVVREAQAERTSIFDKSPKSGPALDYAAFIDEYIQEGNSDG